MVESSSKTTSASGSQEPPGRSTSLAIGLVVVALLIVLAVIGGSAEHGAGAAELRRGPAPVVLSVLVTLAGLAGIGSLALLFWGLVTRNWRSRRLWTPTAPPCAGRGWRLGHVRFLIGTARARRTRPTPSVRPGTRPELGLPRGRNKRFSALQRRRLFHPDPRSHKLLGSMGTVGDSFDNAPMESFGGSMQIELINRKKWMTNVELLSAIADYIVNFYNPSRRRSSLDYLTPDKFETLRSPDNPVRTLITVGQ